MELHADQGYVLPPWNGPLVANLAWMLDDFTADNGATLVVPGSHLPNGRPDPLAHDEAIAAEALAGR